MNKNEALRACIQFRVAKRSMTRMARANEAEETRNFLKAVVDASSNRILGAAILGLNGGEL